MATAAVPYLMALTSGQAADRRPAGHDRLARRDSSEIGAASARAPLRAAARTSSPRCNSLAQRHRLLMFTKGQRRTNSCRKLAALRTCAAVRLGGSRRRAEKDVDAYRRPRARRRPRLRSLTYYDRATARALRHPIAAVGRWAARRFHSASRTRGKLEHEEINEAGDRIIELSSFRRLVEVF